MNAVNTKQKSFDYTFFLWILFAGSSFVFNILLSSYFENFYWRVVYPLLPFPSLIISIIFGYLITLLGLYLMKRSDKEIKGNKDKTIEKSKYKLMNSCQSLIGIFAIGSLTAYWMFPDLPITGIESIGTDRLTIYSLGTAAIASFAVWAFRIYKDADQKNLRPGMEYGSSKKGDIYKDAVELSAEHNVHNPDPDANILLSRNIKIDMDTWHTKLNNNIFIVGGSGTGKTRFYVKPNILQFYGNYIVIDPKGSVAEEVGQACLNAGYDIRYLNFNDMNKSMGYNPFKYFESPTDVQKYVKNLIDNTSEKTYSGGDEFFVKAETTLLTAFIYFIMATAETEDEGMNMNSVLNLLELSEIHEDVQDFKSPVDLMFEELEMDLESEHTKIGFDYASLAVMNYKIFKMGASDTIKSVLISLGVRLSIFNIPELKRIFEKDELHLERFGEPLVKSKNEEYANDLGKDLDRNLFEIIKPDDDYEMLDKNRLRKSILFIVIDDNDTTFSFMASIILQQMYTLLYSAADNRKDHKLPIHTRFINDEFANCGKQPDFNKKISTMRSREISTSIIVQGVSQLKSKSFYGDDWETIFENCDTTLFLGSKGDSTLSAVQKLAGKETVTHKTQSVTKGQNASVSTSEQIMARDVFDYAEISNLDPDKCLVHIRGHHIFEDFKFDVKDHPRVSQTKDGCSNDDLESIHFDIDAYRIKAEQIEIDRKKSAREEIKDKKGIDLDLLDSLKNGELIGTSENGLFNAEQIIFSAHAFKEIDEDIANLSFSRKESLLPN